METTQNESVRSEVGQVVGEVIIIAGVLYLANRVFRAAVRRQARKDRKKNK